MAIRRALLVLVGMGLVTGCGPAPEPADGMLAEVGGSVQKLSVEEARKVCADSAGQAGEPAQAVKPFCEPNYLYTADFGRRRTIPAPAPAPAPTVPPVTPGYQDNADYSRQLLGLSEAWRITQGSRQIIVAVVDTGVDYTHPDLKNNIWVNEKELNGRPGVDDDGDGYIDDVYGWDFYNNRPNGMDDALHGTHVAGTIGAELNGLGVVGVSPVVKIMPLKFLGANGSGDTAGAIRAIDYAIAHGANIISNSWGGGGRSQLLENAIQRATARGILVVAAAGNSANDIDYRPSYPAAHPGVIAVASTDARDALSSFSNYGAQSVMIAAPGSEILSTAPGGRYATLSGTSMATPQVSGALALALSLNKSVMPETVKQVLCESSRKILLDRVQCGRMDVAAFIRSMSQR